MRRTVPLALFALALVACAGSPRPHPSAPAPTPPPAAPVAEPALVAAPAPAPVATPTPTPLDPSPWQFVLLPEFGVLGTVHATERDGTARIVAGGRRYERRRGRTRFASDSTLHAIVAAAARADGGYRFATADGALWTAPSFLGPLTLTAVSPHRLRAGLPSREVLVARTEGGPLLLGDDAGWREASVLASAPVQSAAFAGRELGVMIESSGRVLRLRPDAPPEAVPLPEAATAEVLPVGDAVLVGTARGALRIGVRGAPVPARWPTPQRAAPPNAVEVRWVPAGDPLRYPLAMLGSDGVLDDGRLLEVTELDDEGRAERWLVDRTGAGQRVPTPPEGCGTTQLAGGTVVAWCGEEFEPQQLLRLERAGRWHRVEVLSPAAAGTSRTGHGGALVTRGGCKADHDAMSLVCWYDGEALREVALQDDPDGEVTPVAVSRTVLLVSRERRTEDRVHSEYFVARAGAANPVAVVLEGPDAILGESGVTADGTLYGVAYVGSGTTPQRLAALGRAGDRLVLHPLPERAHSVGFVDAARGLAAGTTLDEVWSTFDGGAHWTRITLPGNPDLRGIELTTPGVVQCSPRSCVVGGRLLWLPPDTAATITARTVAAPR
jgi:hypothetical protein